MIQVSAIPSVFFQRARLWQPVGKKRGWGRSEYKHNKEHNSREGPMDPVLSKPSLVRLQVCFVRCSWTAAQNFNKQRARITFNCSTFECPPSIRAVFRGCSNRYCPRSDVETFILSPHVPLNIELSGIPPRLREEISRDKSVNVVLMWGPTLLVSGQETEKASSVLPPSWRSMFFGRFVCKWKWMDRPLTMQLHSSAVKWISAGGELKAHTGTFKSQI